MNNGSFEKTNVDCYTGYSMWGVTYWGVMDSLTLCSGSGYCSVCNNRVPTYGSFYSQYPKTGNAYASSTFYYFLGRRYIKNRLKTNLQAGKVYCAKFYVNLADNNSYGIDGFGAFFYNNELDTVPCHSLITYVSPQIQNPQGNVITDTVNWTPITGTFTANGTEKYMVIGNFISDNNLTTVTVNPQLLPTAFTSVNIDDVSCIPIDLEAYAGRDTTIFLNDSVYIGRENDFAIDTGCVWYKLPNTTAIDTISGMWVKPPIGTHTYVVRQELECSSLKWDTVIVNVKEKIIDTTDINVNELRIENENLRIYPNPTSGMLNVECEMLNGEAELQVITILGKVIKHSIVTTKHSQIDVSGLDNGIYFVNFKVEKYGNVTKKLIISK